MNEGQALALAEKGNTRAAEEALMAALEEDDAGIQDWPAVIELIVKASKDNSTDTLAWATLDAILVRRSPREAIPLSGKILRLFSKNNEFRDRAVELYKSAFDEVENLDQLIELSGLKGGKPIRRALQTLDLCLAIRPGDFLVHKDEGPPAKIVQIDPVSWSVRIEALSGEELFDPVSLGDQYEQAAPEDFRVLQQFDPDGFVKKLSTMPAEIIMTMVKSQGNRITSNELELMLSPRYVPKGEWSKWWTRARQAMKKNPHLRLEGRNPVTILFEERAVSIEDEIWNAFDIHASPKSWLDLGQKYLRECKTRGIPQNNEFLIKLRDAVQKETVVLEKRKDAESLAAWLTTYELARLAGEEMDGCEALRIINDAPSIRDAFLWLHADAHWPMALKCLKTGRTETWPEDYAALLPITSPSRCDELADQIRTCGKEHLLDGVVQEIMSDGMTNANGLCWFYWGPKNTAGLQIPALITLVTRIFDVLDQIRHSSTIPHDMVRDIRARIRSTFSAQKCKRFHACLEQIDSGMADALKTRIQRSEGLSEAAKSDLLSCIHEHFPDLWAKRQIQMWEDPEALYCTEAGYKKKDAELDELVNVKMKENAIAIGDAAEHGDLSENSEYKFALEERDLLRARVAELQSQMAIANVLHGEDVATSHVNVGSKVEFKHLPSDQSVTITFLGPWESDIDNNVLNYQAPLSQQVMGLRVGQSVEFEFKGLQGEFEVTSIDSAIQ